MEKFFGVLTLTALIATPVLAKESIEVEVPATLETAADFEAANTAVLEAAEALCDRVNYVGLSAFYKAPLHARCVADTYAENLDKVDNGRLAAYLNGELETVLEVAAN